MSTAIHLYSLRRIWIGMLAGTLCATTLIGNENADTVNEALQNPATTRETAGKWAGHKIIYKRIRETTRSIGTNHDYWQYHDDNFIEMHGADSKVSDTLFEKLLSWETNTTEWEARPDDVSNEIWAEIGQKKAPEIIVVAKNQSLKLFNGIKSNSHLVAEFDFQNGNLKLAPGFRKKIIAGMYRKDSTSQYDLLIDILCKTSLDDQILNTLSFYGINWIIAAGEYDRALDSLNRLGYAVEDDLMLKVQCQSLRDSLHVLKNTLQPAHLVEAHKVDSLRLPPVYPPQDSPSVFWRAKQLCVVQEEDKPVQWMRCYDTQTQRWNLKEKIRFPETGLSGLFEKWTKSGNRLASPCGFNQTVCWHPKLGKLDEEACYGLSCDPLIFLANSGWDSFGDEPEKSNGQETQEKPFEHFTGSVGKESDLLKAGGSCSAQFGKLEFGERGQFKRSGNPWVEWDIFPAQVQYGRREYPAPVRSEYNGRIVNFPGSRPYPVVVSPDQNWIAFATQSKTENLFDLWISKLVYRK